MISGGPIFICMKHLLATIIALLTLVIVSCGPKDPCKKFACYNGGVCHDGLCTCPTGFAGVHCQTKVAPDPCAAVTCPTGYICDSGICKCPLGYEGVNCEICSRDRFIDSFSVHEDGSSSLATVYGAKVRVGSPTARDIEFLHFNNYFVSAITAYVTHDSVIIPLQTHEGKRVTGWGVYRDSSAAKPYDHIELRYRVFDTANSSINDYGYDTVHYGGQPSEWRK